MAQIRYIQKGEFARGYDSILSQYPLDVSNRALKDIMAASGLSTADDIDFPGFASLNANGKIPTTSIDSPSIIVQDGTDQAMIDAINAANILNASWGAGMSVKVILPQRVYVWHQAAQHPAFNFGAQVEQDGGIIYWVPNGADNPIPDGRQGGRLISWDASPGTISGGGVKNLRVTSEDTIYGKTALYLKDVIDFEIERNRAYGTQWIGGPDHGSVFIETHGREQIKIKGSHMYCDTPWLAGLNDNPAGNVPVDISSIHACTFIVTAARTNAAIMFEPNAVFQNLEIINVDAVRGGGLLRILNNASTQNSICLTIDNCRSEQSADATKYFVDMESDAFYFHAVRISNCAPDDTANAFKFSKVRNLVLDNIMYEGASGARTFLNVANCDSISGREWNKGSSIITGISTVEALAVLNERVASTTPTHRIKGVNVNDYITSGNVFGGNIEMRQGVIGKIIGANFNVTTDQSIALPANYIIEKIIVTNASINLTTAAGGIYSAISKGGTAVVAAGQVYSALSASAKILALTLAVTDRRTDALLYLNLTTPQGAPATADVYVIGYKLS